MPMTIPQALQWWSQRLGRKIHFSVIPPACERLLAQARAAGIPVGQLYIVSRPLSAGGFGTYDRETGDLCCYYEASRGEAGQRELLQCLLILLASLKLQHPIPKTVGQEWVYTREAIEAAYTLAQQWEAADLFTLDERARLLIQGEERAERHHLAGQLAGCLTPWVARTAYAALHDRRRQFPTLDTQERFAEAIAGTSSNALANDGMVTFDRSLLRGRWAVTSTRPRGEIASFQDLTVTLVPHSARILRAALARVASWIDEPLPISVPSSCWYQEVADEVDLALLIRMVNTWLIDSHPDAAVRLYCWVYGEDDVTHPVSSRIYRLSLSYEDAPLDGCRTRDLWVLFATFPTQDQRALEDAWQRFLLPWLTWSEVLCESLAQGLQMLWMLHGGRA